MRWTDKARECVWVMYDPELSVAENARVIAEHMRLRPDQVVAQLYVLRKERTPMVVEEKASRNANPHRQEPGDDSNDLLRDMRCQVEFTHVATMPIPLYERMKAAIAAMPAEKEAGDRIGITDSIPSAPQVDIEIAAKAMQKAAGGDGDDRYRERYFKPLAEACAKAWNLTPTTGDSND